MNEIEGAAGLAVRGADAVAGAPEARTRLVGAGAPGLLARKDPTLWGPAAEAEAAIRLGWIDTFRRSRDLVDELAVLRDRLSGTDHVVLAGMGGSSLAPEVISRTLDVPLTVLDTTDPHQVRAALGDRLERAVVVVASKSGSTVETDSHRRAYWQAFSDAGLTGIGDRFVVVTDPGSPLEAVARDMSAHVIRADPNVGGRFSALTAFGLVPAALAGVNIAELLDQAEAVAASIGRDADNPALALASGLGASSGAPAGVDARRDKVALIDDGTGIRGLGDWAEQLIAESTGKDGTGLLPVVVENPIAPGATGGDVLTVTYGGALAPGAVPGSGVHPHVAINGPLGAQFLVWEAATALAGLLLGINPFDQPNVAESKENTYKILSAGMPEQTPLFVDGAVEVHAPGAGGARTLGQALAWLARAVDRSGYLAVMAFLDRLGDAAVAGLRPALSRATDRPVTFGWGPRFLHSTGQYHKGGPQNGAFLQITGAVSADLDVPGKPYSFAALQAAQAAGDRQALIGRGRPVLWLHLVDRVDGVAQLLAAADDLAGSGDGGPGR